MRVLGVAVLSLLGAIVSFFSTLAVLDETFLETWSSTRESRIGAFAAPGLSVIGAASLASLRPIPVTIAPASSTTRPTAETAGNGAPGAGRKSALVAPLVRRAPPTPVLASDETPPVTQLSAIAKAPKPEQPRIASRKTISPELRSALGGPLPAPSQRAMPPATKPRPALARTPAPSLQGPSP